MKSLSIVADQQIPFVKEAFSNIADITLIDGRAIEHKTIVNADVLFVRSITKVDQTLLENSAVRFVGSATSGIDHIDCRYLQDHDIHFTYTAGSNARSVAEYVLSSLFVIAELQDYSLSDKSVGIIGCGHIGSLLVQFLEALGVRCLINDPPLAKTQQDPRYVSLETALGADILSIHVPLQSAGEFPTQNLLNKNTLALLKPNIILINTARGNIINEQDLIAFKNNHPAATLILDVWQHEPNINQDLLKLTTIATPHIAGYSLDGKLNATRMLFTDLMNWANLKNDQATLNQLAQQQYPLNLAGDMISLAVLQSYDVRSDASALRHLLTLKGRDAALYFDDLRKNYPVRREFTKRLIHATGTDKNLLRQLGFIVA